MSKFFEPIELEWNGEQYTIPSNRVLGAIAIIENHVTFTELADAAVKNRMPMVRLSQAWGAVLRYAGAKIEDDEVYSLMFSGDIKNQIVTSVNALMVMMLPPSAIAKAEKEYVAKLNGAQDAGNRKAAKVTPKAKVSRPSRKSTKRLSVPAA